MKQLSSLKGATAVSIYLPTHLAPDARQDAIRLKNLLDRAEEELEAGGMPREDAEVLLAPARRLPSQDAFWKGLSQGLAILATPALFRAYRLPVAFKESVTVHRRLNIKPLLPIADRGERFLLLALSQNHSRLFDVTRSGIRAIAEKRIPESKRQALN